MKAVSGVQSFQRLYQELIRPHIASSLGYLILAAFCRRLEKKEFTLHHMKGRRQKPILSYLHRLAIHVSPRALRILVLKSWPDLLSALILAGIW